MRMYVSSCKSGHEKIWKKSRGKLCSLQKTSFHVKDTHILAFECGFFRKWVLHSRKNSAVEMFLVPYNFNDLEYLFKSHKFLRCQIFISLSQMSQAFNLEIKNKNLINENLSTTSRIIFEVHFFRHNGKIDGQISTQTPSRWQ